MIKKQCLLLALCFISISGFAQKLNWGEEFREDRRAYVGDILDSKDGEIVSIIKSGKFMSKDVSISLARHDADMNLQKLVELNLNPENKKISFEGIVDQGDRYLVFTSFSNRDQKMLYLFAEHIDKTSLQVEGNKQMIAEINYADFSRYNPGDFSAIMSRDKSKFLIYYFLPNERKAPEHIGLKVMDKDLNELWKKDVVMPYSADLFQIADYVLDNSGDVYILGRLFKERSRKREYYAFTHRLISFAEKGTKETDTELKVKGKALLEMNLTIAENQDLVCVGFYANASDSRGAAVGSYYLQVNGSSKEIKTENFSKFDFDFLVEGLSDRQKGKVSKRQDKGKAVGFYQFDLKDLIIKEQGGVVMVAEMAYDYVITSTSTVNNVTTTTTTHYYVNNDIILINMNQSGETLWSAKIPKRQQSTNDGGRTNSYAMGIKGDRVYFLYNEHEKSTVESFDKLRSHSGGSKSALVYIEVDNRGNMEKQLIHYNKKAKLLPVPKIHAQISDRELILIGLTKRGFKFGKFDMAN